MYYRDGQLQETWANNVLPALEEFPVNTSLSQNRIVNIVLAFMRSEIKDNIRLRHNESPCQTICKLVFGLTDRI